MTTHPLTARNTLRLWPGLVAIVVQWLAWLVLPKLAPDALLYGFAGAMVCGAVVVLWWLFFSRAPWVERVGAILLMIAGVFVTSRVVHQSISNGMMGLMLPVYSVPALSLALVLGVVVGTRFSQGFRRAVVTAAILLACGVFTMLRTGGITADGRSDLHWRWTDSPEQRLLARSVGMPAMPTPVGPASTAVPVPGDSMAPGSEPPPGPATKAPANPVLAATPPGMIAPTPVDWPGFRGPLRDDVVRGVRIDTDWVRKPPVAQWHRPIGPGWSSFAVDGHLLYTQEQRGADEVVACYNLSTGEPVWSHRDTARFWESNAGAGPRGTPTLHHGRVYSLGATGIMNALDARTGAVIWSRNAKVDTGAPVPGWGFAGSPLVVNDLVIVAASGRLAAYDLATGKPRWFRPTGGGGYSSPHLATIGGTTQVVLLSGAGATGVSPIDGALLWQYKSPDAGVSIVQPALTADGDVLVGAVDGNAAAMGMRRLAVTRVPSGWTVQARWTSTGLKPYFNDFVLHQGYAFGFDGSILACLDLETGKRAWKGGRYGAGQLLLLADQDVLLVLSEEGELALVSATADQFHELARVPGIEGKTWNHPVLVGDLLLVRNGEEMAAFRLALAER